jgi:hypothetical protein
MAEGDCTDGGRVERVNYDEDHEPRIRLASRRHSRMSRGEAPVVTLSRPARSHCLSAHPIVATVAILVTLAMRCLEL